MKYHAKKEEALTPDEMAEFSTFGFCEKFARLLFIRGVDTEEKVKAYFDFSLERLHDPFLLKGMREAAERIESAISNKERILIIGDYDADGICAVAILYKYLILQHASTRYFLPDRNDDGYGLNVDLIGKLHKRFSPKLIITVDCGISCHEEVAFAKSLGIDCIVTDHHSIPTQTPDCICINPKFTDQAYPFNELCGAGVALKVVHALGGIEAAEKYIDICSIATVADIVALKDENRVITSLGLAKLNENSLPSITSLAKSCNTYGQIKSSDISFKIGPKINASGRMGNAKRGLDIVLEQDNAEIEKIIQSLTSYNTQRQVLCNSIYADVEKVIEREKLYKNNIIIVADEKWESGVLGIVSARITEKYGKPSIIFGRSENIYKGSGRSIESINLVKTIEEFSDLLLTFGGHSMAAGLSVSVDNYETFHSNIIGFLNENYKNIDLKSDKYYDFSIDIDEITPELVREFEQIEPTGCENPAPLFMTTVTSSQVGTLSNYPAHLRFTHKNIQFMFFNGAELGDIITYYSPKKVIFEFQKIDENKSIKCIAKHVLPIPIDAKSYALCLAGHLRGNFAIENDIKFTNILNLLTCDREVFIDYYKRIKPVHGVRAYNAYDLFSKLDCGANENKITLYQFVFCVTVFQQLGILAFQNGYLILNSNMTTDLFASPAYNMIRERGVVDVKIDMTEKLLSKKDLA
jgi:single-stranded-DNA-specific exonuclease